MSVCQPGPGSRRNQGSTIEGECCPLVASLASEVEDGLETVRCRDLSAAHGEGLQVACEAGEVHVVRQREVVLRETSRNECRAADEGRGGEQRLVRMRAAELPGGRRDPCEGLCMGWT